MAPAIAAVSALRSVVVSPMLSGPSGVQEAAAPANPGPIPPGSDEAHGVRCGWRAFAPALRPLPCLAGRPIRRDRICRVTGKTPREAPPCHRTTPTARPYISMRAAHRGRSDTDGTGRWAQQCALGITGCPTVRCYGWTLRWGVGWARSTRPP